MPHTVYSSSWFCIKILLNNTKIFKWGSIFLKVKNVNLIFRTSTWYLNFKTWYCYFETSSKIDAIVIIIEWVANDPVIEGADDGLVEGIEGLVTDDEEVEEVEGLVDGESSLQCVKLMEGMMEHCTLPLLYSTKIQISSKTAVI